MSEQASEPDVLDDESWPCGSCGGVKCAPGCPELAWAVFEEARMVRLNTSVKPEGMVVSSFAGSEGPSHDPYSFTDYRVQMPDGRQFRYRSGMIEELWESGLVGWVELERGGGWGSGDRSIRARFEELVGWPIDQIEWWAEAVYRNSPCMACGRESGCRGRCME